VYVLYWWTSAHMCFKARVCVVWLESLYMKRLWILACIIAKHADINKITPQIQMGQKDYGGI